MISAKHARSDSTSLPLDLSHSGHHTSGTMAIPSITIDSRRGSVISLATPSTGRDASDHTVSPLIDDLKAELEEARSSLSDLQTQLASHDQIVSDAHASLQSALDGLRTKRKEDDADRQELKSRTRSLEEQKRQAEAARREGEKKLRTIEALRDGLEGKIAAAMNDISDTKGRTEDGERNRHELQEDGAKHVVSIKEAMALKQEEITAVEGDLGELDTKNEELGKAVQEAEERLRLAEEQGEQDKPIEPEEEMMMMAAAYEAAAQEGFQHGHQPYHHPVNPYPGSNQWATQAAAYMAEAGMPYVDQNYTARPASTLSSGFGHLTQPLPRSTGSDLDKRFAPTGFGDFGLPLSGPAPVGAGFVAPKRPATPPASDSESDVYGHDPGSPNGGISSTFSANLLPQGLFRSLDGDVTPFDAESESDEAERDHPGPAKSEGSTLSEALLFDPHEDRGSNSDSGEEGIEPWLKSERDPKRLSGSRLLPSSTTPPGASSFGLPLTSPWPGSSATSAENVSSFLFSHPSLSNDSLSLTGFDAASNPFAPSASEKKALALKWPLGKWRVPSRPEPSDATARFDLSSGFGAGWLSSRAASSPLSLPIGNGKVPEEMDEEIKGSTGEGRKFGRFFSLRRTGTGGTAAASPNPAEDPPQ